jgi:hypothetical protein
MMNEYRRRIVFKHTKLTKSIVLLVLSLTVLVKVVNAETFVPPQKVIPPTLFGLHIHRLASSTPWPPVGFNSWSLVDAIVNWRDLQPTKSKWNFGFLDMYVDQANKHNVDLLLPLAFTPPWASARPTLPGPYGPGTGSEPQKIEDWNEYVRTVGNRYNGKIEYYQVWDEPNEKLFFSGTQEKLFELVFSANKILKEINPNIKMVSPGVVGESFDWLDTFLSKREASAVDVIGYHFYTPVGGPDKADQRPESMIPAAKRVKGIMAKHNISYKPLWNTGIGYWNVNSDGTPETMNAVDSRWIRLNREQAAAWVSRTFILGWALGMERVFWYSWDNENLGLIEPGSKALKPAARAYQTTYNWLVGSTMSYCANDGDSLWTCELKRGTRIAWLVWRTKDHVETKIPARFKVKEYQTLQGETLRIKKPGQTISIGEQPILLKADKLPWSN